MLSLAGRLVHLARVGVAHGGDTASYFEACTLWASDPSAALGAFVGAEYMGFTLPFCAVYGATGSAFAWVALQTVLAGVAAGLVFDIGRRVFSPLAGGIAALAYALSYEMIRWDAFVLTDSWFATVVIATTWAAVRVHERATPGRIALVASLLLVIAVSRPVGIFLAAPWAGFLGWTVLARRGVPRRRLAGLAGATAFTSLVALLVVARAKLAFYSEYLARRWSEGAIMTGDTIWQAPYAGPPTGLAAVWAWTLHVTLVAAKRVAIIWVPWISRYSTSHILLNAVSVLPILLLGAVGFVRECFLRPRAAAWLVAMPIVMVHVVVVIAHMDWDWRYRNPMLPALMLFTGAVLAPLLARVMEKAARTWPRLRPLLPREETPRSG